MLLAEKSNSDRDMISNGRVQMVNWITNLIIKHGARKDKKQICGFCNRFLVFFREIKQKCNPPQEKVLLR